MRLMSRTLEQLSFLILIHLTGPHLQAPSELAYTMEVNEKCDVYSFGILALEILSGKHIGELISSIMLSTSGRVVASTLDNLSLNDKLDQRLPHPTNPTAKEVISIVRIAIA